MCICQAWWTMLRKTPESLWLNKIRLLFLAPPSPQSPSPAWAWGRTDGTLLYFLIWQPLPAVPMLPPLLRAPLGSSTSNLPTTTDGVWMVQEVFQPGWEVVQIGSPHTGQSSGHHPSSMHDGKMYSGNSCWVRENSYGLWCCVSQSGLLPAHITVNWCGRWLVRRHFPGPKPRSTEAEELSVGPGTRIWRSCPSLCFQHPHV